MYAIRRRIENYSSPVLAINYLIRLIIATMIITISITTRSTLTKNTDEIIDDVNESNWTEYYLSSSSSSIIHRKKWTSGNPDVDNAYLIMNFHRTEMNEYLCYNYVRSNVVSIWSSDAERVNASSSSSSDNDELNASFEGKSEPLVRPNERKYLLDDEGSRAYKIWLASKAKKPNILNRVDNLNKRPATPLLSTRIDNFNRRQNPVNNNNAVPNVYLQPPTGNSNGEYHPPPASSSGSAHYHDDTYYYEEPTYETASPPVWIDHHPQHNKWCRINNGSSEGVVNSISNFLSKNGHQLAMTTMTFVSFIMLLINMLMNMNIAVKPSTTMAISVNNTNIAINDGGNSSSNSNDGSNSNASTSRKNSQTGLISVMDNLISRDIILRHLPFRDERTRQFISSLIKANNFSFDFT